MRKTIRMALFSCAVLAGLAFAGGAFASYAPRLVVASITPQAAGSGGPVRIGVVTASADDPTAKTQIYIPTGYQIASPAPGTKLGDVTATASAADLGGALLPLTGELDAIAPNTSAAAQCGVTASQYWDLHMMAAGQTLDVPVYVVTASAGEQAAGYQAKLVVCLPPPDVPAGTPGRATFGAKLLSATFGVSAITEPVASGDYRWTSLWTPYNPGKGTPNAAGTVEAQSVRHIPTQLALTVTRKKLTTTKTVKVHGKKHKVKTIRTQVHFSAKVTESGQPATTATVTTTAGGKKVGGASGSFILTTSTATVTATALVNHSLAIPTGTQPAATDLSYADLGSGGCVATAAFGGLPCEDATVGASSVHGSVVVHKYLR